jgi:hypothetical protein
MKRLIVNVFLFVVAILLLITLGSFGILYTVLYSVKNIKNVAFLNYWADLLYQINVGIDQIGNVLLARFLNNFAIINNDYPFGKVNMTISHVLAVNYKNNNIAPLGLFIILILECIDTGHIEKSI